MLIGTHTVVLLLCGVDYCILGGRHSKVSKHHSQEWNLSLGHSVKYISLYLNQKTDFLYIYILWNIDNRVTLAQWNVLGFSIKTDDL